MERARRRRLRRTETFAALLCCGALAACASFRGLPSAPPADASRIARDVAWLAHDDREGRGPGSHGLDAAAQHLAEGFRRAGFAPGGDEHSYLQRFETPVSIHVDRAVLRLDDETLVQGSDFEPLLSSESARLRARVVFAGYGISAPELSYDDYTGLDVEGAAVLVLSDRPGGRDGPIGGVHGNALLRRAYKVATARQRGAAAVLVAPASRSAQGLAVHGNGAANPTIRSGGLPVLALDRRTAERIIAAGSPQRLSDLQRRIDTGGRPASLRLETQVEIDLAIERTTGPTANVIAVLAGSDPALRHQAVVIGAHYDHLGRGDFGSLVPDRRGEIHNGADDNASGSAGLLELARMFSSQPPPRRSLVLAAFSGEELGLMGSRAYVEEPAVPIADTVAMINLDMVGRLREGKLYVLGSETSPAFPRLVRRATRGLELQTKLATGGFAPSDQTSFYAADVPVLFFFTGPHPEYHTDADDAELVDAAGVAAVLAAVYRAARQLLDAPERPELNAGQPPAHGGAGAGGGYGPYLGTVPDFSGSAGAGVRIQAVTADSPAARAGMRAGDRVVAFAGTEVANLEEYAALLFASEPGETVEIVVLRDGRRIALRATLGQRR